MRVGINKVLIQVPSDRKQCILATLRLIGGIKLKYKYSVESVISFGLSKYMWNLSAVQELYGSCSVNLVTHCRDELIKNVDEVSKFPNCVI